MSRMNLFSLVGRGCAHCRFGEYGVVVWAVLGDMGSQCDSFRRGMVLKAELKCLKGVMMGMRVIVLGRGLQTCIQLTQNQHRGTERLVSPARSQLASSCRTSPLADTVQCRIYRISILSKLQGRNTVISRDAI
jgi:hypothetical protein